MPIAAAHPVKVQSDNAVREPGDRSSINISAELAEIPFQGGAREVVKVALRTFRLVRGVLLPFGPGRYPAYDRAVTTTSEPFMLNPAQMAQAAEDAAYGKATSRPLKSFLLGLTGGAFIALGFVFYTTSQVGAAALAWSGGAKVAGGIVFATGLVLVVLTGAELFTSSTLTLTARASGRISWAQLFRNWGSSTSRTSWAR